MEADQYLQMILSIFIVIVLVLVFILYTQSSRNNITSKDVDSLQKKWGNAIETMTKTYLNGGDYVKLAEEGLDELYAYNFGEVLFKPTKSTDHPFRDKKHLALSYFVGGDVIPNGLKEDKGFAINGGEGWKSVVFKNHKIDLRGDTAIAMGTYIFTSAKTDEKAKVYYTFGYKRCRDNKIRIFLHHSSLPFTK